MCPEYTMVCYNKCSVDVSWMNETHISHSEISHSAISDPKAFKTTTHIPLHLLSPPTYTSHTPSSHNSHALRPHPCSPTTHKPTEFSCPEPWHLHPSHSQIIPWACTPTPLTPTAHAALMPGALPLLTSLPPPTSNAVMCRCYTLTVAERQALTFWIIKEIILRVWHIVNTSSLVSIHNRLICPLLNQSLAREVSKVFGYLKKNLSGCQSRLEVVASKPEFVLTMGKKKKTVLKVGCRRYPEEITVISWIWRIASE